LISRRADERGEASFDAFDQRLAHTGKVNP
jgi:hypothetical protein